MSFAEEHCGTNAIALAAKLNTAVYTTSQYHYCDFLRETHFYSIPLCVNQKLLGYLAIAVFEQTMQKELFAITDLMEYKIINEYIKKPSKTIIYEKNQVKLSEKQLIVLRLLASGKPDKTIAVVAGLRLCTIKYHKKNIFRRLGVSSSIEAVIKALKLNMISIDQINL
jgi:DNA-binding CsgD family transcriptional regulator